MVGDDKDLFNNYGILNKKFNVFLLIFIKDNKIRSFAEFTQTNCYYTERISSTDFSQAGPAVLDSMLPKTISGSLTLPGSP